MSKAKKQVPLRLSQELHEELNAWAKDDFRSLNGQIEYLLTACVRSRKKSGRYVPSSSKALEPTADDLGNARDSSN